MKVSDQCHTPAALHPDQMRPLFFE